jgi:hypothetical protein
MIYLVFVLGASCAIIAAWENAQFGYANSQNVIQGVAFGAAFCIVSIVALIGPAFASRLWKSTKALSISVWALVAVSFPVNCAILFMAMPDSTNRKADKILAPLFNVSPDTFAILVHGSLILGLSLGAAMCLSFSEIEWSDRQTHTSVSK